MRTFMSLILLTLVFSAVVTGQDISSIEGKTFNIDEYTWVFKNNNIVFVSGGQAGDGVEGKYEQDGGKISIKVTTLDIFGTYDGFEFVITTVEERNAAQEELPSKIDYSSVRIRKFPIALQCWTYRRYSFMETLDKAKNLGIKYLQAYPGQKFAPDSEKKFDTDLPEQDRALVKKRLKELGLSIELFGVTGFSDEASARKLFSFAKDMGISTIVIEPEFHLLPLADKLANQYKINVAIHNHPEPSRYWHPGIIYFHIKDLSPRMGICGDTGHWTRSGVTPSDALKLFKGRVLDVHLKDLNEFGKKEAYDVPFGSGQSNIQNILAELSLQNYHGFLTIEHEKEEDAMSPEAAISEGLNYIKKITYFEGYDELLGYRGRTYNKHGWNHYGPGYFELDEASGVLTSSGGMGLLWYSQKMYENFVLDLDFKCHAGNTNSGIFLHIPEMVTSNDYIYKSFEIQIDDDDTLTKHTTGAVYDAEPAKMLASNPTGEWNHYRITFIDDMIKVELNGLLVNTWKAEPRGKIKSFARKGYIGLQNHDSQAKVSFKNIFVKEL